MGYSFNQRYAMLHRRLGKIAQKVEDLEVQRVAVMDEIRSLTLSHVKTVEQAEQFEELLQAQLHACQEIRKESRREREAEEVFLSSSGGGGGTGSDLTADELGEHVGE